MKPVDPSQSPDNLGPCPRCGNREIAFFHSEKVEGYYVSECRECGAYTEIMRADVFETYRPQKPKKTGDQEEPWISRLIPKRELNFRDRRTSLIDQIFKKIEKKKNR